VQPPSGNILATAKVGTTLGRYQLLATVGHGAMATVFRARDTQLGRDVAVKVMSMAHAARGGAAERFRREAHAVAALKHPGILEIYDFVSATDEEPSYIVAELIKGPTLRELLEARRGRLLPEFAALIALPLADALALAHERGVIHRDVKPDNVMIEASGDGSRVVLTDFGVAQITGMETMTAPGALVGSPAYMSPEQSRGHDVGPAADLWSLGAMLYEMVTGVVPFAGKDPFTMIAAILRGTFRRPSQVVATVGPDFEAMIMRCLKANPAERYASAGALASELRVFARSAGLVPEAQALRRYLDDAEGAEAALRPRVADTAVERARQAARRGQLARALAELGHATAYVPKHAGAERLLKRLSAGRLVIKATMVLAGLMAAVAIAWLSKPLLDGRPVQPVPSLSKLSPTVSPALSAPVAKPVAAISETSHPATTPAAPSPATVVGQTTATVPRTATAPARPQTRSSHRIRTNDTPPPSAGAAGSPTPEPQASEPEPTPAPPPQVLQPAAGTIALFAKGGFCYPSLDDLPVRDLMPVFRDIPPGKHKVYCSRTRSSAKELAGEVDLPPGAKIERTVTEQAGRLVLARPR
jgi:serine/threonine-protein kinase